MFIETRSVVTTAGTRRKFYLAYSIKRKGKVRKIRHYLGADLTQEQIDRILPRAQSIIHRQIAELRGIIDPFHTVLSKDEHAKLLRLIHKGGIKVGHLNEREWERFTELFAYHTNAIEGSTLRLSEVEGILERDDWPPKAKEEISETYGVREAIRHIRTTGDSLSLQLIRELHRLVFRNSKRYAGTFRTVEVVIKDAKGAIVHRGAPSASIISLLNELIRWYGENKQRYHPVVLAAVVHNQFENIHPFQDGNGRMGRLLLNNILLKQDYPPVNINLGHRKAYYKALRSYQDLGDIRPMVALMLREYKVMEKNVWKAREPRVRQEYLRKLDRIRKGKFVKVADIDRY